MEYTLVLDESGQFINSKNGMPAMVAGYLVNWHGLDEAWAKSQFSKAKRLRRDYKNIDTNNFHGKDIPVSISKNFLVDLIKSFVNKNVRIVEFKNQKNVFIVDSDTTYLNCFSEGVISLLKELLKETDDDINLKILYAHRQQTELREQTGQKIRIPMEQYNSRLQERLEMLRLRLPISSQKRIHFDKDYLADANAVKDARLMLADAICYTFRGGNFGSDVLDQLKELETLVYFVPNQTMSMVEYLAGHYESALQYLSLAFSDTPTTDSEEVFLLLTRQKDTSAHFGLMHYTRIMMLAMVADTPLGNQMYNICQKHHLEESIKSIEYPNSIIVWSLASCAARRNEKKARGLYESAINEQVKDPQHYTNIATGVLMEIERLMTIQNIRKSYIRRLQNDYRLLIGDDSPNSIKEIFLTFYDFVHTVTESNIPLYKKDIVTKTALYNF